MDEEQRRKAKLVREIAQEFDNVRHQARHIQRDICATLERNWQAASAGAAPDFDVIARRLMASQYAVFSSPQNAFHFEAPLSNHDTLSRTSDVQFSLERFDTVFGRGVSQLVRLALASREMQFDFANKRVVIPFCLFESVCGLVVAQCERLETAEYYEITSFVEDTFTSLRKNILDQHWWENLVMARAQ